MARLPEVACAQNPRVSSTLDVDLWASPLWFLLILLATGTEWALRRWWQLKQRRGGGALVAAIPAPGNRPEASPEG